MTTDEKKYAIASLIFLTEKRDYTIKARQCADGGKQCDYMMKEDSTLLTVSTESIFLTSVINTRENRETAVVELPEAFLHAENDQEVIMFIQGGLAELTRLIAPQIYRKFVMMEIRQKVLYVNVQKAL